MDLFIHVPLDWRSRTNPPPEREMPDLPTDTPIPTPKCQKPTRKLGARRGFFRSSSRGEELLGYFYPSYLGCVEQGSLNASPQHPILALRGVVQRIVARSVHQGHVGTTLQKQRGGFRAPTFARQDQSRPAQGEDRKRSPGHQA